MSKSPEKIVDRVLDEGGWKAVMRLVGTALDMYIEKLGDDTDEADQLLSAKSSITSVSQCFREEENCKSDIGELGCLTCEHAVWPE